MMLFRCLARVVLIPTLMTGCSGQSLFADGNGGNGTPADARSDPSPDPDAREGDPDAREGDPDAREEDRDAGGPGPDARVSFEDVAFAQFRLQQGGTNGRWRYVEVQAGTDDYVDMATATFSETVVGFIGTGTPAPSLAYCTEVEISPPCAGVQGQLALTTTASGANHPGLMWIVPEPGTYGVSVTFRAASDTPQVSTTMMLALNDQANVLDSRTDVIDLRTQELYADAEVEAGDRIVLSAIAATETSMSVGVTLIITGPY